MITESQWNSLLWLKPSHFKYSDKIKWAVVRNLDTLISRIGSRPVVLSDWRPYENNRGGVQQHFEGTAIDTVWPGQDPFVIWQHIRDSKLFTGMGIYVNEVGAVSFHVDNRVSRTVDSPALWGDFIKYPFDPAEGKNVRKDNYVGADAVLDFLKKKGTSATAIAVGMVAAYLLLNPKQRKSWPRSRKQRQRRWKKMRRKHSGRTNQN